MLKTQAKDRWQLTGETLACLLSALGNEQEVALERYKRLQERLILFFMRHRSVFPEDLADEVINRVARALFEGREVATLEAFALGVARMVVREEQARLFREQRAFQEAERNRSASGHTPYEGEGGADAKEAELAALPEEARQLLAQYHAGSGAARIDSRRGLAQEMGVSMGALRKRVFDLQSSLRQSFQRALGHPSAPPERKEKTHH